MDDSKPTLSPMYIFVRVLFLIASSGVLINAAYIYGYMFYQGYISALGFDFVLFPLSRSDAFMWSYLASINTVSNMLASGVGYFVTSVFLIGVVVFLLSLIWKSLPVFGSENLKDKTNKKPKIVIWLREKHPELFARIKVIVLRKFRDRVVSSLMAFQAINICALLILLWFLLPLVGMEHGKNYGEKVIAGYETSLCAKLKNEWNWCIRLGDDSDFIEGRLILKSGNLLGIYTLDGPVTISMPDDLLIPRTKLLTTSLPQ